MKHHRGPSNDVDLKQENEKLKSQNAVITLPSFLIFPIDSHEKNIRIEGQ